MCVSEKDCYKRMAAMYIIDISILIGVIQLLLKGPL
ncbi:hypothetical protein LCGC14_2406720 [marine sediment metagenome]|uniref:Uncharacterized protein n=1 Tax=marine sediment metagenome TaxID=412755 RepID=A0A0F9E620_9ZZZZ